MYSDAQLEDLLASQENIEDEENNMKVPILSDSSMETIQSCNRNMDNRWVDIILVMAAKFQRVISTRLKRDLIAITRV